MYQDEERPPYRRFPKVPIERRVYAFLIDFVTVWLVSSLLATGIVRWLLFLLLWFGLRVFLVYTNHGQSLGRWALDMKLIDARFNKVPLLISLAKREGIAGGGALLAMIGFNLAFVNLISAILLVAPLLADCGIALSDDQYQQAFHDKIAGSLVIETHRGFSLDLRLKKLLAELRRNMKK
ncbi:MAG: RDD family protein [Chroococcales cyanobacterium]